MKPIGGIVSNKKSIPENFRRVEIFTTEYLSKLWKIYTVNRDVLDKGRRLENLFWRIWGSERTQRTFSGKTVSRIFLMILEGERPFEKTRFRIPPLPIPTPPHPPHSESTPRPSLEIECPPTPPPSPIPPITSVTGFHLESSYLSRLPSQMAITASLHQAFPPAPPSPPPPSRPSHSTAEKLVNPASPQHTDSPGPSRFAVPSYTKKMASTSKAESKPSSLVFNEYEPMSSEEGSGGKNPGVKERKAKAERPVRGRRKVGVSARVTATRKSRPVGSRRKSSSSSNTAVNTAVSSPSRTLSGDMARSLPSASLREQEKTSSTDGGFESDAVEKRGGTTDSNWIVDPDFRTKYLERKRKEKLVALTSAASVVPLMAKAMPTVAVVESQATASTKISRGKGKGVVLVDQIIPLKGLQEEAGDLQAARVLVANARDEDIDELPTTLVRRKSELTLMFEAEAKKFGEKTVKGGLKKEHVIIEGEMAQ